jgi:transposase
MMGYQTARQEKLFYLQVSPEKRVRANHPLRQIARVINFDFVYAEVADKYGTKGNVSVPPPVILKWMLLLVLYHVRSERELMGTIPERLDWLWFLGYDLDSVDQKFGFTASRPTVNRRATDCQAR